MKIARIVLPLGLCLVGLAACSSQPQTMSISDVKEMVLVAQCPALALVGDYGSAMVGAIGGDMNAYHQSAREMAAVNRQGITLLKSSYDRLPEDLNTPIAGVVSVKEMTVQHMEAASEAQSFEEVPETSDSSAAERWKNLGDRIGISDLATECDDQKYSLDRLNEEVAKLPGK